jgi:hypothetical protein
MKNIKLIGGIFLILTAFIFTSCENEPVDSYIDLDDFNTPPVAAKVFKVDFGGDTWKATEMLAVMSGSTISIGATRADGSTFSILVDGSTVGSYPANENIIAYTPSGSTFGYWSINTTTPTENTGSIEITAIDTVNHTISGTFQFKGYWSDGSTTSIIPVQFTNGVFTSIPY